MQEIAVLMPAFNAEQTIGVAVRSTLRALPDGSSLIVYDDCSQDDTIERVRRIGDRRLSIIRGETNVGVARALNYMVSVTSSKYVGRMDADDICLPGRFSRQLRQMRQGCSASFTSVVNFGDSLGSYRPMAPLSLGPVQNSYGLLLENVLAHSTLVVRRSEIPSQPYRETAAEDYELWLRLIAAGSQILRLGAPGIMYRRHRAQVTAGKGWHRDAVSSSDFQETYWKAVGCVLGQTVADRRCLVEVCDAVIASKAEIFSEGKVAGSRILKKAQRLRSVEQCVCGSHGK